MSKELRYYTDTRIGAIKRPLPKVESNLVSLSVESKKDEFKRLLPGEWHDNPKKSKAAFFETEGLL